jgi:tRNA(Ile)-lysidine synthase
MPHNLVDKVRLFCLKHRLVESGNSILLAVSGGLDSVVMLDVFVKLRAVFELKLAVLHVNHSIRGGESDKDEQFVIEIAQTRGLKLYNKRVNVPACCKANKSSLEEGARELRYKVYVRVLSESGYLKVATAHTANDQAETVIDHLLRGSGIRGMRGILPKRDSYIRPMLDCRREEVESYALSHRIEYRNDASNSDLKFKRNRIRHQLIPVLMKHYNPGIVQTLNRTAGLFAEAES